MSGTRNKRKHRMRPRIRLEDVYKEIAKEMACMETNCKRTILAALNSWVYTLTSKMNPIEAKRHYSYSASFAVLEVQRHMENR